MKLKEFEQESKVVLGYNPNYKINIWIITDVNTLLNLYITLEEKTQICNEEIIYVDTLPQGGGT